MLTRIARTLINVYVTVAREHIGGSRQQHLTLGCVFLNERILTDAVRKTVSA